MLQALVACLFALPGSSAQMESTSPFSIAKKSFRLLGYPGTGTTWLFLWVGNPGITLVCIGKRSIVMTPPRDTQLCSWLTLQVMG